MYKNVPKWRMLYHLNCVTLKLILTQNSKLLCFSQASVQNTYMNYHYTVNLSWSFHVPVLLLLANSIRIFGRELHQYQREISMPNNADIYDALFTLTFCKVVVNSRCKGGARYDNIIWYRYFAREFENQIYFLFTMSYCRLDRNCSVRTFCNSTVIFHRFCLH